MDYKNFIKNPKKFQSLTYFSPSKFEKLLIRFSKELPKHKPKKPFRMRPRRPGGGRKSVSLYNDAQKLFFILYYLRHYPTFDALSANFDLSTSRIYYWVNLLINVLDSCLDDQIKLKMVRKHFPDGTSRKVAPSLKVFSADGTERPIQRPSDDTLQKKFYSGKKNSILSRTSFMFLSEPEES